MEFSFYLRSNDCVGHKREEREVKKIEELTKNDRPWLNSKEINGIAKCHFAKCD